MVSEVQGGKMNIIQLITRSKNNKILKDVFRYFLLSNKSNCLPYHNIHHTLTMFRHLEMLKQKTEITEHEHLLLQIAVFFHDFNHSGGEYIDQVNIQFATQAINDFKKEYSNNNLTNEDWKQIKEIIKATEYPYIINDEDLTICQKIIRDLDLLMGLETTFIETTIVGLAKEFNRSIESMIKDQINFIKSVKFHTLYCKDIQDLILSSRLKDLEELYKIITHESSR